MRKSNAEIQRNYRTRQRLKMARIDKLVEQLNRAIKAKDAERKDQILKAALFDFGAEEERDRNRTLN